MWHEARRQEKQIRNRMVDNVRRHERRKIFYESIRKDPEEFMQVHGQRMPIHMDTSFTDPTSTLRKWQGDPNILIDRFDVRVHLETLDISEPKKHLHPKQLKDDVLDLQCEYERYRILVFNEFLRVSEKSALSQISSKEFWPLVSSSRKELDKKKKFSEKRAAIGFNYGDSEVHSGNSNERDSDSDLDDEIEEAEENDVSLKADQFSAEQAAELNKLGTKYNIGAGMFYNIMKIDQKEQHDTAEIKEIDKAKLALSGRQMKADRALLKRRRAMIVGKGTHSNDEATTTLLSFLAKAKNLPEDDSSSSESAEDVERTEFITIFSGESSNATNKNQQKNECENDGVVQGPYLPNKEYRRLLELRRRRSISQEKAWESSPRGRLLHSPSPKRERRRDRSYSPKYRRGDHRNRHRSRSSSYQRDRKRTDSRESISRKKDGHRGKHHGRSRSRSSSCDHRRNKQASKSETTHHSNHSRILSTLSKCDGGAKDLKLQTTSANVLGQSTATSSSSNSSSSTSSSSSSSSSSSDSDSPLSIYSSMSESEKERIEIENRKRRIRKTKRQARKPKRRNSSSRGADNEQKSFAAKKLRQQMQNALTKTAEQLKAEEESKFREQIRERKQREEELFEESRLLRQREREKRKIVEKERDSDRQSSGRHRRGSSERR